MLVDSGECLRVSRIFGMPRTPTLEPQPIAFLLVGGAWFRLTIERLQTPDGFQIRPAMSPFSMSSVVGRTFASSSSPSPQRESGKALYAEQKECCFTRISSPNNVWPG